MIPLDANVIGPCTRGDLFFDAQIVALCQEYGISNVLTNDRDFERYNGIVVQYI